ncbi:hypothetical protein OR1_02445 [Geobacter sp. OR-1]|uniref:chitobiase/beta-hexosaminidase C-terminal domain-containing protein n=1 Tax=Geobacter sp. OR-1 TaxID=1266765 RepID=UPI000542713F|nr:chitobiase/beta-hexosaminidase C-terminal domain-containing protein [Geobacter sp. OR-1]GAM10157.1 hypothetical protein OR1_02445 [Geobacter sp. OR-1]
MKCLHRICRNLLLSVPQVLLMLLTAQFAMAGQLTWSNKTLLPTATSRAASVVVNGTIYVLGGATNSGTTAAVEAYDPLTDSWLAKPALSETRFAGGETVLDGVVYIAGGSAVGSTPTAAILSYDTASGSGAAAVGTLVTPRIRCSAAILNNKMYVVGGSNNSGTVFDTIEEFDLTSHESIIKATMPVPLHYAAVVVSQGNIYIIGGFGSDGMPLNSTWLYDPVANSFTPKSALPVPVAARAAVAEDGKVYLLGGMTNFNTMTWTAVVQSYDPQTDSWQSLGDIPTTRYAQAVGIVNNSLYVIGGNNDVGPASGNLSVNESADLSSATGPVVTASPFGGTYAAPQNVTLTANEPSTIYYTIDGSAPTTASGVYTSPIGIYTNTTLKFFARNGAGNDGTVKTESYTILPPPPVTTASPAGGTFTAPQTVTLTANDGSANIYYTLDGSTPTTSSAMYGGALNISTTTTLKFFAVNGNGQESVNSITYEIIVAPGGGSIGFAPVQIALPYKAWSVAAADFNQDGKADLAVANYERNTVSTYRGNGDGTFTGAQEIGVGSQPTAVTFGTVNGYDSYIDIVAANSGSGSASVLLGNGAGSFSYSGAISIGSGSPSVAVGHFRNAGPPDVAAVNPSTGYLNIYYGQGPGSFTAGPSYYVGAGAISVTKSDFNGDYKEDLAVVNYDTGQLTILTGDGAGYFYSVFPGTYSQLQYSRSVAAGDINGDGKTDLAIVNDGGEAPGGTALVSILLGNGNGSFQQYTQFQQPQYTSGAAIADFNNDGKADLVLVNRSNNTMSVLLQGFQFGNPVLINPANPVYFATVQAALDSAGNGDVMQTIAGDLYENLIIDRGVEITIKGGVSAGGAATGYTTLHGTLTISSGSLIAENLTIV